MSDKSFAERFPYSLENISVFKWSLVKWIKEVLETIDMEDDWVVGIIEENNLVGEDLDEGDTDLSFREINDVEGIIETFNTLYLNANYFNYDKYIGFNKVRGNQYSNFKKRKEKEEIIYAYRKDTFIQHTKGLLGAFQSNFLPSLNFIFKAFNQHFKANTDFKKLIQLILILHDYGKLDVRWQNWMQEYQKELSLIPNSVYTYEENVPLGHTGFNKKEEKVLYNDTLERLTKAAEDKIFKKRGKRPPHSGVGAKVIIDVLEEWAEENEYLSDLAIPASIAIARHHGVSNIKYPDFNISNHNYNAIQQLLEEYGFNEIELDKKNRRAGELEVMEFSEFDRYILYLFFVRILRLCDQKATEDFEKYIKG